MPADAIAPHVAYRLWQFTRGNGEALAELRDSLTDSELAGLERLPDPLPATTATRRALRLSELKVADRHLLLVAATAVTDSTAVLLAASAVEIDVLLDGTAGSHLILEGGRFRFADDRVRAVVLADAAHSDRVHAHNALARALRGHGLAAMAAWHECAGGNLSAERRSTVLLSLVDTRVAHGDFLTAYAMAAYAAEVSTSQLRARTHLVAARVALWCGQLNDADRHLRMAMLSGGAYRDQIDELRPVLELLREGPSGTGDLKSRLISLMSPLAAVAMTPADRTAMRRLVEISAAFLQGDFAHADGIQAELFLGLIPAIPLGLWSDRAGALSPLAEAHVCLQQAAFQTQADDFPGAARTLQSGIRRLPLVHAGAGIVSSYVRLIAPHTSGLDVRLADTFDRLAPARTLAYRLFGVSMGRRSRVAGERASSHLRELPDDEPATWSDPLTTREREVARCTALGWSNQQTADTLGLSIRTVEVHLTRIFRKMGVTSRSQLVAYALRAPTVTHTQ